MKLPLPARPELVEGLPFTSGRHRAAPVCADRLDPVTALLIRCGAYRDTADPDGSRIELEAA